MMDSMVSRGVVNSMVSRCMMSNMVSGMMEATMGYRMGLNMDMSWGIMVYSVDMVGGDMMMHSMMNRVNRDNWGMDNSVDNLSRSCFNINNSWSINYSRGRGKVESRDRSRNRGSLDKG